MDSRPMLHFRLVDDQGVVLVDEDVWLAEVDERANHHGDLARQALDAGRITTLYVTDPDGVIPPVTIVSQS